MTPFCPRYRILRLQQLRGYLFFVKSLRGPLVATILGSYNLNTRFPAFLQIGGGCLSQGADF